MNLKKKNLFFIIPSFLILLTLNGCSPAAKPYTKSGFALDTIVGITIYDTDKSHAEAVLEDVLSKGLYSDSLFEILPVTFTG